MEGAAHLLVVDDDQRLCGLLLRYLSAEGFSVTTASDAEEAETQMAAFAFDLLILDIMLSGTSGLEFACSLRNSSAVPILLLSAKGEPNDRILGLQAGADDYLAKPFEPQELVLRINAILRRARPENETGKSLLRFGNHLFDSDRNQLTLSGTQVHLTETETQILAQLAAKAGEPVSRETLAGTSDAGKIRSVDVQMTRLRRKIEVDPHLPRYLQTVRGTGYILLVD
ncbi:MAG: response regulator transcription factor [Rhodospirillales bacterium]|nr:response regulator transcription factor [Rhodospirillales bacterium]